MRGKSAWLIYGKLTNRARAYHNPTETERKLLEKSPEYRQKYEGTHESHQTEPDYSWAPT